MIVSMVFIISPTIFRAIDILDKLINTFEQFGHSSNFWILLLQKEQILSLDFSRINSLSDEKSSTIIKSPGP